MSAISNSQIIKLQLNNGDTVTAHTSPVYGNIETAATVLKKAVNKHLKTCLNLDAKPIEVKLLNVKVFTADGILDKFSGAIDSQLTNQYLNKVLEKYH